MHEVMAAVSETRIYDFVTEQQMIAKAIGTTQRLSTALKMRVQLRIRLENQLRPLKCESK
jgi:hypothetical protein